MKSAPALGLLAMGVSVLLGSASAMYAEEPRVGFVETFDDAAHWQVVRGAPLKALTAEDGVLRFETVRGAIGSMRPDWPDWDAHLEQRTNVERRYDVEVDLDVYRYLVVDMPERGTAVTLSVAGRGTPVGYTSGLRAFDLRHAGLTGRHRMRLTVSMLNNSGAVSLAEVRLVRELTDAERAVLMDPPMQRRIEQRGAHPYHRLEAVRERVGRSTRRAADRGERDGGRQRAGDRALG